MLMDIIVTLTKISIECLCHPLMPLLNRGYVYYHRYEKIE